MLSKQLLVRLVILVAAMAVGVLLGPWLVGTLSGVAYSEGILAAPVEQVEPAAGVYITCDVREVAVFNSRIHVRCYYGNAPGTAIIYFAAPTSDTQRAARLLSTMLTAHASGKQLGIGYDTADNGSSFGCATSNCRPINYLAILE